ncbi:MAG TPA: MBL fold metallo-hydrolase [Acidimicrobiales bacterium]|nr:MBL fold metallo-hydrolase [Acidimicrobiales bacterium]
MTELTFLGTGNYLAPPGRYWNSFVMDGSVLVEPSPTSLPHLRRCGFRPSDVQVVVISHFHADHCFGWPFLLQAMAEVGGGRTLHVVGPPGVEMHLADMMEVGAVRSVLELGHERLDLRFVEVDGSSQEAGGLRFRAVEVEHVPYLRCFGYLFERDGGTLGYSGDVRPCAGLHELATEADALVLECNGQHGGPKSHMHEADVRDLQAAHPETHFVLTHLGEQVDVSSMPGVTIPDDFERLIL